MNLLVEVPGKAALVKVIEQTVAKPGALPNPSLPFANLKFAKFSEAIEPTEEAHTVIVTHGLGKLPGSVVVTNTNDTNFGMSLEVFDETDTTFSVRAFDGGVEFSAVQFNWIAVC